VKEPVKVEVKEQVQVEGMEQVKALVKVEVTTIETSFITS